MREWRESATGGKIPHDPEGWEPVRFEYREIDHCCQNFSLVDGWLDERGLQRRGGRSVMQRGAPHPLAGYRGGCDGTTQAKRDHILHPRGVDEECDDAWMSLEAKA